MHESHRNTVLNDKLVCMACEATENTFQGEQECPRANTIIEPIVNNTRIKVGQLWITSDDQEVKILSLDGTDNDYPIVGQFTDRSHEIGTWDFRGVSEDFANLKHQSDGLPNYKDGYIIIEFDTPFFETWEKARDFIRDHSLTAFAIVNLEVNRGENLDSEE